MKMKLLDKTVELNPLNEQFGFYFEYTDSYEAPELNFQMLKELSDYFSTDEIHVDSDINNPGCDTCDWGSSYGHTIYVTNPKKNVPDLKYSKKD